MECASIIILIVKVSSKPHLTPVSAKYCSLSYHNAGLYQKDLIFKNLFSFFLLKESRVFFYKGNFY